MIALQRISIEWNKSHRGAGPGAVRNALPRIEAFQPPGDPATDWVQTIRYHGNWREGDGWQPVYDRTVEWHQRMPQPYPDNIRVDIRGDIAEVHYVPETVLEGKITRRHLPGVVARLPKGKRFVLHINGVDDVGGPRRYREATINIAFDEAPTLDLPVYRVLDERKLLY
ncbi:hypothetical protein [Citromicrobium bathyomarinum]|uniref:hypothetical protein n=1 Tax=Citromicrobium bathyomarinum TaxID=72174 RepID=UPI003159BC8F